MQEFGTPDLTLPKFGDVLTLMKKSFQHSQVLKGDKGDG